MKRTKICSALVILLVCSLLFTACMAQEEGFANDAHGPNYGYQNNLYPSAPEADAEDSEGLIENPFLSTNEQNVSTLSADVDTASYSYFRKMVANGYSLQDLIRTGSAFRTEEFINYFRYESKAPDAGELFGVQAELVDCPWNSSAVLLRMTLQAEQAEKKDGNNLVFLIDVSGSMQSSDKLPLLQESFSILIDQLDSNDTVSIVTYSGEERVVLEGCRGDQKTTLKNAILSLEAQGSTYGEAGLKKAYELAARYHIEGGNNRIIMASDGDLNVGISSAEELKNFVSEKRAQGTYLSVLGFGTGNYRDSNMEALADNGNGVYYYIDGASEAEKVFGADLFSTLYTIAKDVKLQVTFNPAAVASYRLIGYENRILNEEDFRDDTKDAGDVGAGHQVTVCYELVLTEQAKAMEEEWLTLAISYKPENEEMSRENSYAIGKENYMPEAGDDIRFIISLIQTAMILHQSNYLGDTTLENVLEELAGQELGGDAYRTEFYNLIQKLVSQK